MLSSYSQALFRVPENWQPAMLLALARWHLDLKSGLRFSISIQINNFRALCSLPRFGLRYAFLPARGVCHEWNAEPEPSDRFSIAVLQKTLSYFRPGNRLLDAQQDSSNLTACRSLDEAD